MAAAAQTESTVVQLTDGRRRRERVALDRIEVKDRLRPIDRDWAAALAVSIEREGPIQLIELRPLPGGRLRLIHGAHRLEAYRILGWTDVETEILDVDAMTARAREIAENLMRRELSPLDRAAFVAELYEVEKERAGWEEDQSAQSFSIGRRWAKDTSAKLALVSGLADQVAEKVGLSRRSVFRDLSIFKDIQPAVRQLLATHPVSENASQLRLLARSGEQMRIAQMLVAGEAADVARALKVISPASCASPQDKALSAFLGGWERMGVRERREALRQLKGLPKGVRITFDGGSDD